MHGHLPPVATLARAWGPRTVHLLAKVATVVAVLAIGSWAAADDTWPSFRRNGSGTITAQNVPMTWSPEEGIAWRSEITGYGQSAPVVWNDTVYVTSSDGPFQQRCFVHAFDPPPSRCDADADRQLVLVPASPSGQVFKASGLGIGQRHVSDGNPADPVTRFI